MMGHKDKLKGGLEWDVIFGRKYFCYLGNRPLLVKFAKRALNRRNRFRFRKEIKIFGNDETEHLMAYQTNKKRLDAAIKNLNKITTNHPNLHQSQ